MHKQLSWGIWLLIVVFLFVLWLLVGGKAKSTNISKTNRELALVCTTDMATQFHIHPRLIIMIDGGSYEIPHNIGVRSNCMNPLHTHGTDGTIHIESPEKRDFTLSDFFAVWDKPYSREQILDYRTDEEYVIVETVNGKMVEDYENTVLRDGDQIVISYEKRG